MSLLNRLFQGRRNYEQQQQTNQQQQAAGTNGNAAAPTPAPAPTPDSLLEDAAKLWKIDPSKVNAAAPGAGNYFANVDPAKVAAAISQMNFTKGISPELMQRVKDGDASAFAEAINLSNQATMQATLMAIPGIMQPVLQQAEQRAATTAGTQMRQAQLQSTVTGDPVLDSAAFKPMVDAMKQVHANNNPQLSPEQVTQVVRDNMRQMLDAASKIPATAPAPADVSATKKDAGDNFSFLFR